MGRRSDHSRDEISEMALDAARQIVTDSGLGALTARKVANEIGYAPGTLYLVFNNLDDLIVHLNAQTLDKLFMDLQETAERYQEPQDCILALAKAYVSFSLENARLWSAIYDHHLPEGKVVPAWFQERIERLFGLVEEPLRKLDPDKSGDEVRLATNALWSGIHGACTLSLSGSLEKTNGASVMEIADSLVGNYLQGYCR